MDYRKFVFCYQCDAHVEVKFQPAIEHYVHTCHCPLCKGPMSMSWHDYEDYCNTENCPNSFS